MYFEKVIIAMMIIISVKIIITTAQQVLGR